MKQDKFIYIPEYIRDLVDMWEPVGSRECCVPAPTNTDLDILILSENNERFELLEEELMANKWLEDGNYGMTDFYSWKKKHEGELVNLIITTSPNFYSKFLAAHAVCKEKNFLNKKDRIAEFEKWLPKKEDTFFKGWDEPVKKVGTLKKGVTFNKYNWASSFAAVTAGGVASNPTFFDANLAAEGYFNEEPT